MDNPVVSIVCITYNHEPYIRQCLDGFLMQKTDFPFEVLIHDDASTDRTADIIREYEVKYPHIIKPIYQTENQFSKGVKIGLTYLYPNARGKYIAECEGDDYWTDPLKLQKQVDILEENPGYVICTHRYVEIFNGTDEKIYSICVDGYLKEYDLGTLVSGQWYYQPLSMVFLRQALDLDLLARFKSSVDVSLLYVLLKSGKGLYVNEVMGVYRRHAAGVWTGTTMDYKLKAEFTTRLNIYDVERTDEAAMFLLCMYSKSLSRRWAIKNHRYIRKTLSIFAFHWGWSCMLSILYKKFVLGQSYDIKQL